jgi:hypothetical protein
MGFFSFFIIFRVFWRSFFARVLISSRVREATETFGKGEWNLTHFVRLHDDKGLAAVRAGLRSHLRVFVKAMMAGVGWVSFIAPGETMLVGVSRIFGRRGEEALADGWWWIWCVCLLVI